MSSYIRSLSHTQTPTQQVDDADVETWTRINDSITLKHKHTSLCMRVYMSESVSMETHTYAYLSRTYPTLVQ